MTLLTPPSNPPLRPASRLASTAAYFAAFIVLGLVVASLGPTLPGLAAKTQTRLGEISVLFAARSLGVLFGSLLSGRMFDRVSGHPLMATMLLLTAVCLGFVPLIPLLWLLTAVMLLIGMAEGAVDVGGNTLLMWIHGSSVGPYMNGLHFFFGVGAFLAPIIVAQAILMTGGIAWAFWVLALLALPPAIFLLRLPTPVMTGGNQASSVKQADGRMVALVAAFFFLYVGAEASFGGWVYTYTTTLGLSAGATAAYLTSAFWGALTAGRLLAIPLAVKVRPRHLLAAGLAGCVISIVIILLWPGSLMAVWMGALGAGFFMAAIFPTTLSLAEHYMPISGRVTAWFMVGASLGAMSVPWLIGQLFERFGPTAVMVSILLDLLGAVMIFILLRLHGEHRERSWPAAPGID